MDQAVLSPALLSGYRQQTSNIDAGRGAFPSLSFRPTAKLSRKQKVWSEARQAFTFLWLGSRLIREKLVHHVGSLRMKKTKPAAKKTFSQAYINSLPTIGEIARRYGLTLRALRFYEDRGIVAPIRIGSARFYDEQAEVRIRKILEAKRLGYTMQTIKRLIESGADEVDTILDGKRVMDRIAELRQNRDAIDRAIAALQDTYRNMPKATSDERVIEEDVRQQSAPASDS